MQDAEESEVSLREACMRRVSPVGLTSCLRCWMRAKGIVEEHGTVLVSFGEERTLGQNGE